MADPVASEEVPHDLKRPILYNDDGTWSTENTITLETDGRYHVVPTIVNGRQLDMEEAGALFMEGKNPAVSPPNGFPDAAEANAYAQRRHEAEQALRQQEARPNLAVSRLPPKAPPLAPTKTLEDIFGDDVQLNPIVDPASIDAARIPTEMLERAKRLRGLVVLSPRSDAPWEEQKLRLEVAELLHVDTSEVPLEQVKRLRDAFAGKVNPEDRELVAFDLEHPEVLDSMIALQREKFDGLSIRDVEVTRWRAAAHAVAAEFNYITAEVQNTLHFLSIPFIPENERQTPEQREANTQKSRQQLEQAVSDFRNPGRILGQGVYKEVETTLTDPSTWPTVREFQRQKARLKADALWIDYNHARRAGDAKAAIELRSRIHDLKMKASVGVNEPSMLVESIGSVFASSTDIMAVQAGLMGLGRGLQALPHPAAKVAGTALLWATPYATKAYAGWTTFAPVYGANLGKMYETPVPEGRDPNIFYEELDFVAYSDAVTQTWIELMTLPGQSKMLGKLSAFVAEKDFVKKSALLAKDSQLRNTFQWAAPRFREAVAENFKEEALQSLSENLWDHMADIVRGEAAAPELGTWGVQAFEQGLGGAVGGAFMAGSMAPLGLATEQFEEARAAMNYAVLKSMSNMDEESAKLISQNPSLSRAFTSNARKTTGAKISTIYVDAPALYAQLQREKYAETIEDFAKRTGLDSVTITRAVENGDRVAIPLSTWLDQLARTELGRELLQHSSGDSTTPTLSELHERHRKDDKLKDESEDARKALAWEQASALLDTFQSDLKKIGGNLRIQLFTRTLLERAIRVSVSRGWASDYREAAMAIVPVVETTRMPRVFSASDIPEVKVRTALAKEPASTTRMGPARGFALTAPMLASERRAELPPVDTTKEISVKVHFPVNTRIEFDDTTTGTKAEGRVVGYSQDLTTKHFKLSVKRDAGHVEDVLVSQVVKTEVTPQSTKESPYTERSIIGLTVAAPKNASMSIMHELAHTFFFYLKGAARLPQANQSIKDAWAATLRLCGWESPEQYERQLERTNKLLGEIREALNKAGVPDNDRPTAINTKWSWPTDPFVEKEVRAKLAYINNYREKVEKFAVKFERYLAEGEAPSTILRKVFAFFRAHLTTLAGELGYTYTIGAQNAETVDFNATRDSSMFNVIFATDTEIYNNQVFEQSLHLAATPVLRAGPDQPGLSPEQWLADSDLKARQLTKSAQVAEQRAIKKTLALVEGVMKRANQAMSEKMIADPHSAWDMASPVGIVHTWAEDAFPVITRSVAVKLFGDKTAAYEKFKALGKIKKDGFKAALSSYEQFVQMAEAATGAKIKDIVSTIEQAAASPTSFRKSAIRAYVAQQNLKRFGPQLEEINNRTKVVEQAISDKGTVDLLLGELVALFRSGGVNKGKHTLARELKDAARQFLQNRQMSEVTVRKLTLLSERYARKAVMAAAEGNFTAAAIAYRQRLLYVYAAQEAITYIPRFRDLANSIKDIAQLTTRGEIAKGGIEFVDAYTLLAQAFGLATNDTVSDLGGQFAIEQAAQKIVDDEGMELGFDVQQLRATMEKTKLMTGTPMERLAHLTFDECSNVEAAINQIRAASGRYARYYSEEAKQRIADAVVKMVDETKHQRRGALIYENPTWWQAFRNKINYKRGAEMNIEYLSSRLGPSMRKFWYTRFKDSQAKDNMLSRLVLGKFVEMYRQMPKDVRENLTDTDLDFTGVPMPPHRGWAVVNRDRAWMIMVALNMGNPSNIRALLRGYGWTYNDVKAFLEKNMTDAEATFVQSVWDFMDEQVYPLVREHYKRVNGIDPMFVQGMELPLNLKSGERVLAGGYFPIRMRIMETENTRMKKDPQSLRDVYQDRKFQGAVVAKGFTKARKWAPSIVDVLNINEVTPETELEEMRRKMGLSTQPMEAKKPEAFQPLIDLTWSVVPSHLSEVLHYIVYDEPVRDWWSFVMHMGEQPTPGTDGQPGFAPMATEILGQGGAVQLKHWVKDVAAGRYFTEHSATRALSIEAFANKAKFIISTLGYSLSIPLGDASNVHTAVVAGYATPGTLAAAMNSDWYDSYEFAVLNSRTLATRYDRQAETLRKDVSRMVSNTNLYFKAENWVKDHAWVTFDMADQALTSMVWYATYHNYLNKHSTTVPDGQGGTIQIPNTDAHEAAIDFADECIARIFPATDVLEKSAVLRDRGIVAALYAFGSWFNQQYIMQRHLMDPFLDRMAKMSGVHRKVIPATAMSLKVLGLWAGMQLLGEFLSGRGPEEDENTLVWAARKLVSAPLLMRPVYGPFWELGWNKFIRSTTGEGNFAISDRSNPVIAQITSLVRDGQSLWDMSFNEDVDFEPDRAALTLWTLYGMYRGLPSAQVRRSVQGTWAFMEGEVDNPLSAFIYGDRAADSMSILNPFP